MEEEKKKPDMILVVDDEPDMKELIEQKFSARIRNKEWEFVYAANGFEALERLEAFPGIGVVLLDIMMHGMDGLTFLDKLTAMDKPAIKTIMVTAYGDMKNIRRSMNEGAFDFITKPVNFDDLKIIIENAIKESDIIKESLEAKKKLTDYKKELEIAALVQKSILPHRFPSYLFADMRAAKKVLGDFYDYTLIEKNRIVFFVGDVEGKGLPAALLAIKCSTTLKNLAEKGKRPDDCLKILNDCLIEERDEEVKVAAKSVSIFYGELDLRSGDIEYSMGGKMGFIYIIHGNGEVIRLDDLEGFPLGLFGNRDYECGRIKLSKQDMICICTDGVGDAQDAQEESFGNDENRVISTLKKMAGLPVKETVETFMTEIAAFVGGAPQTDDITIMALKLA